MKHEEDMGSELFGSNLFEHATKRELEAERKDEPEKVWLIYPGRKFPARQPVYRFRGTASEARTAALQLCGTYKEEDLKNEE